MYLVSLLMGNIFGLIGLTINDTQKPKPIIDFKINPYLQGGGEDMGGIILDSQKLAISSDLFDLTLIRRRLGGKFATKIFKVLFLWNRKSD